MGIRRLPALILVLGVSAIAPAPAIAEPPDHPAAKIGMVTGPQPTGESLPLLPVPDSTPEARPPCASCPTDYHPSHVYLPDQSPDCSNGGREGDCHPCRRGWIDMAFFIGKGENLPEVERRYQYGWQLNGGYWFSDERTLGLDTGFFSAHGSWRRVPGPYLIDSPVTTCTFDANLRGELFTVDRFRFDWLLGYRYAQLHERYLLGTTILLADLANRDHINAGQIGLVGTYRYGPYFAELVGKLAAGRSSEDIDIGPVRTTESNTCLLSEFGFRIGYQFGESLWGTLGYQFLYLSNVDRPGQHDSSYYLHGLTIGFEKHF